MILQRLSVKKLFFDRDFEVSGSQLAAGNWFDPYARADRHWLKGHVRFLKAQSAHQEHLDRNAFLLGYENAERSVFSAFVVGSSLNRMALRQCKLNVPRFVQAIELV